MRLIRNYFRVEFECSKKKEQNLEISYLKKKIGKMIAYNDAN